MSDKHCPQCGAPADPDARFCVSCGASLQEAEVIEASEAAEVSEAPADAASAAQAQTPAEPVAAVEVEATSVEVASEPVAPGAPEPPAVEAAPVAEQSAPQDSQTYYAQPAQPTFDEQQAYSQQNYGQQQQTYSQPGNQAYGQPNYVPQPAQPTAAPLPPSPLSQGWRDLTSQPGWFGTAVVLMLLNLVPVLGWYAQGYMLEWAAQAGSGVSGLPKPRFTRDTLWRGFLYGVLSLIGIVIGLGFTLLVKIPFLGVLLYILWMIVVSIFVAMAGVRMTAKGSFGAAFDLSDLWDQFKQSPWSVIWAVFVPGLIAGIIMFLLYMLVFASSFQSIGWLLQDLSYMGTYGMSDLGLESLLQTALGSFTAMGVAGFFVGLVQTVLNTLAQLWSFRSVGVWMSRQDPTWRA